MNYPYSTFIFETQRAKQRLALVFQARSERRAATLSLPNRESVPAISDRQDTGNRRKVLPKISRRRDDLSEVGRKKGLPNESYWTHEDMGTLSFTLTLLLLATVAAAQTDRPILWLMIGPVPLALGLAVVGFVRPRFNLRASVRSLLHRPRRKQCQCQCRCQ
jgi:hypothetical protein